MKKRINLLNLVFFVPAVILSFAVCDGSTV
ncbi:hypothetical protein ABIE48_003813 [Paenibacillus sp. OAE614]